MKPEVENLIMKGDTAFHDSNRVISVAVDALLKIKTDVDLMISINSKARTSRLSYGILGTIETSLSEITTVAAHETLPPQDVALAQAQKIERLRKQRDKLLAALKKFGEHLPNCDCVVDGEIPDGCEDEHDVCTCGFIATIASVKDKW